MRLLHLSDLHFRSKYKEQFKERIINPLIKCIAKEGKVDLVLISGDLIDKGGYGSYEDEFLMLYELIEYLCKEININISNLIITPGNHDIVRSKDSEFSEIGLKTKINSNFDVNEFIQENYSNELVSEGVKRIEPYKVCESILIENSANLVAKSNFDVVYEYYIENSKVSVCSLNSSWRCYGDDDVKNIVLGECQIEKAVRKITNADFKILLMHHHHDMFSKECDKVVQKKIIDYFDLACYGHIHENKEEIICSSEGSLLISVSPQNSTKNSGRDSILYCNGFRIIDIEINDLGKKATIFYYKYNHAFNDFRYNVDLTKNGEHYSIFKYPTAEENAQYIKNKEMVSLGLENRKNIINSELFCNFANKGEPHDIESVFVLPNLIEEYSYKKSEVDKLLSKDKNIKLDSIMNFSDDIYIFGQKECGKTVLLNRIYIEYCNSYTKYKIMPIYIDLIKDDISNLKQKIIFELKIKLKDFEVWIDNNKLVLIVDNITFSNNYKYIDYIEMFRKKYSNIKLICCSEMSILGNIPVDFNEFHKTKNFMVLKFEQLDSKKIRFMVNSWCENSNLMEGSSSNIKREECIDTIVNLVSKVGMSCTPLTVSMFLWIFEENNNYNPVNSANIIEKFIETSLKKHEESNKYRSTFDFTNNQALLSEIAINSDKILKNIYGIEYSVMLQLINNYLVDTFKGSYYKPEKLLERYSNCGILTDIIYDNKIYVCFRYQCFYHYFRMKYMVLYDEYRDKVISKDNILDYVHEIDLYSAQNKTKDRILENLIELYNEYIYPLIDRVNESFLNFDTILEIGSDENWYFEDNEEKRKKKKEEQQQNDKIDKIRDIILNDNNNVNKEDYFEKKSTDIISKAERILYLLANVIRNLEDSKNKELKIMGSIYSIRTSLLLSVLIRLHLLFNINKQDKLSEEDLKYIRVMLNFMPAINQETINDFIGSKKTIEIFEEIFFNNNKYYKDKFNIKNEVEEFTGVFIILDNDINKLNNKNFRDYILNSFSDSYLCNNFLLKMHKYYYLTNSVDNLLENIISEVEIKKRGGTGSTKMNRKGILISKLREKRLNKSFIEKEEDEVK